MTRTDPTFWLFHPRLLAVGPVLWAMLLPLLLLDLSCVLFQFVVFRLLRIPPVLRREHLRMDRHRLPYLHPVQKLGCAYCAYANGVLQFAVRVAARAEAFYCPIRHAAGDGFRSPPHHDDFAPFGDRKAFEARWEQSLDRLDP